MTPIDWNGELEAYHEDGSVVVVELSNTCDQPDKDGYGYKLSESLTKNPDQAQYFKEDGTQVWELSMEHRGGRPWRIRNRKPTPSKYDDEVVEKMVEFVRRCISLTDYENPLPEAPFIGKAITQDELWLAKEARSIAALLPVEVDPDITAAKANAMTYGSLDYERDLAAIKRGRSLAEKELNK